MSRNTVAPGSPSRNVRMRPGCSSTYQRPSGPWIAPVIELNARPPIARTRRICGIAVERVGTGVGDGVAVRLEVGDGDGEAAAADRAHAAIAGAGPPLGAEHPHANPRAPAT